MNSRKIKQIVHVSRLRKYITPVCPTEEPEWIEDDDFNWEQEVAHIKDKGQLSTMEMPAATQSTIEEAKEVDMELSKEYEVQSITDIRKVNGKIQYLVRWKGYSANEDSWEPIENLKCNKLIDQFHQNANTLCNKCIDSAWVDNPYKKT